MAILADLDGDWRKPLSADVPLGHVERRWRRHVVVGGRIDRTHWEMATYSALANALASGDIWVPTSRIHRSLDVLLTPSSGAVSQPASLGDPHACLDEWVEQLDGAMRDVAHNLDGHEAVLFAGERLRFPKEPKEDDAGQGEGRQLALTCYGVLPATLIAEATNLGLSRMAEVGGAASRCGLLRMQTWHMREGIFRAALACLTDAIHDEPVAAWFGQGHRVSADGQAYYLGEPGEAGGAVNAPYCRDSVVKICTTITDRYAPLHQTVIAGTAGEAIHALDRILGHDSNADLTALHVDGGDVSDIVFAVMYLLWLDFEPRIPCCRIAASTPSSLRDATAGSRGCSAAGSAAT